LEDLRKRILPDLTDVELMEAYRQRVRSLVSLQISPEAYWLEFSRRNQEENARIMAQWTRWVGIATVVNVFAALVTSGATLYQIWWGWF
jgi:hypothetical protein